MIFINGSTGFIGRNLIKALSQSSYMTFGHNAKDYPCDILTISNIELSEILDTAETIVHIEAYGSQASSDKHLESVEKTRKIIQCMNEKTRLIYLSTATLYKSSPDEVFGESDSIYPDTEYKASKAMCEAIIKSRVDNYLILRLCNIFGEGCKHGVVYDWKMSAGKDIELKESFPGFIRHFLNIKNASFIISEIINRCNLVSETLNIVGDPIEASRLARIFSKNIKFGNLPPDIHNISDIKIHDNVIRHMPYSYYDTENHLKTYATDGTYSEESSNSPF